METGILIFAIYKNNFYLIKVVYLLDKLGKLAGRYHWYDFFVTILLSCNYNWFSLASIIIWNQVNSVLVNI